MKFKKYLQDFKNSQVLMNMLKEGLNIYTEIDLGGYKHTTFYELAIESGSPELVQACLEAGANPNFVNLKWGAFPPAEKSTLLTAMRSFRPDNLKVLIENGANLNYLYVAPDEHAMHWHLRSNRLPEIEHLEDFSKTEQAKLIALKERLEAGTEIINILRDAGFRIPGVSPDDKNSSFYSLSFWVSESLNEKDEATWYKRSPEEMLEDIYLDHFPIDEEYFSEEYDSDGWPCLLPGHGSRSNALWHAVSPEALKEMLNFGVDVNMRDDLGYTMLHHLAFHSNEDYYFRPDVMLQMLIDNGADVNDANEYGVCPLLLAAERIRPHKKSLELVKILLRNGADYNAVVDECCDIAYWSSNYWYTTGEFENNILWEITSELIRSVTGQSRLSDDDIDLMTAVFWGRPEDLRAILERGANINARTENGYTPLMFASVYNHAPTMKFLIDNGAQINSTNSRGESALYLANLTDDESVISTLMNNGANEDCLSLPRPPKEMITRIDIFVPEE